MATSATNDLLAHAEIHMGFWINWSKGSVRGATLTLTPETGAFLIAFIAIFVQYTGGQFWGILRFILHQVRVSQRPQDGLYHQQQAFLRNQSSGAATVGFVRGALIWRTRARSPIRRSGFLAIIALVHLLGFLVAAIFSTKVSSASGDQVLIGSVACGSLDFGIQDVRALWDLLLPYNLKANLDSASYARSCYSTYGNSGSWQDCRTFPTPNINLRRENTTCPFSGMCTTPAISLDTGLMDSDLIFGVNAPQEDKLAYRKVISCAPIEVDQYTQTKLGMSARTNYTEPEQALELRYIELYYGNAFFNSPEGTESSNYTYRYRDFVDYQNISAGAFPNIFDYVVQAFSYYIDAPNPDSASTFAPIEELIRDDADTHIVLLSANSIVFSSSVDDPWYSAHSHPLQVTVDSNADTASGTVYFADRPVSALGCAEQYQLCANQGADCTPLTSWYGIRKDLEALTTTRRQRAIGNLLLDASTTTVGDTVTTLRDSSLGASFSKFGSVQGSIPSNQWIIDVEGWAAISLARIQRNVLEYASGPSDRRLLPYLNTPNDTVEHDLCHNIKARTRRVENFSVLAIALIFSLGALITIINFGLDFLIGLVQSKRNAADYRRLAWKTNGLLQLQRLAHEEMGYGSWERCTNETPVTRFGDMLASISVDNPKHPTLQKKTENIGPIRTSSNPSPKKEPTVTQSQPLPTQSSSASTRSNPSSNTAMPVSSIPSSLSPSPPTQSTEKRSSSADPSIPALPYSTRT